MLLTLIATPSSASLEAQLVVDGILQLVDIQHAGDGSNRLFLVQQTGEILVYDGDELLPTPFLDIDALVSCCGERGLLGLAFHPDFDANGRFFVNYTGTSGDTRVSQYLVSADPNIADPGSGSILLTIDQPAANHNGGQVRFGPDGYLYVAVGDGGPGNDPDNRGQDLTSLLGKLLRIDVDGAAPYDIPPDNPFVGHPTAREEIWAWGLRHPWRFSFDRDTGDVFIADVGQRLWEEVSVEPSDSPGGRNHGWRLMEGLHCFNPSSGCNDGTLVLPVVEYSHDLGCSVTGGFRYRGPGMPAFSGLYFFADFCEGRIWGVTPSDDPWMATELLDTSLSISTFGEDENGELFLSAYDETNGALYRLVETAGSTPLLTLNREGTGTGRVTSSPPSLECGSICRVHHGTGATVTLTAFPDAGSVFGGFSGDPDCADGVITMSMSRTCAASFVSGFTDPVLTAGLSVVKAVHITDLRAHVNARREACGLEPQLFTDPVLTPGSSPVTAVHVLELRSALDAAYVQCGQMPPTYTEEELEPGSTAIKAVHITELREAVEALE